VISTLQSTADRNTDVPREAPIYPLSAILSYYDRPPKTWPRTSLRICAKSADRTWTTATGKTNPSRSARCTPFRGVGLLRTSSRRVLSSKHAGSRLRLLIAQPAEDCQDKTLPRSQNITRGGDSSPIKTAKAIQDEKRCKACGALAVFGRKSRAPSQRECICNVYWPTGALRTSAIPSQGLPSLQPPPPSLPLPCSR
jgi:hypothetical protein